MDRPLTMALSLHALQTSLPTPSLFAGGTWRWSPEPLALTRAEGRFLRTLGHPLARFQNVCDDIYRRSADGKLPTWISQRLDAGKPSWLVDWQRLPETSSQQPSIIRPDLMLTDSGFALTELDSVPGGIGITAWLSETYSRAGFEVLGGSQGMIDGFRSILPSGASILVSRESGDYRPEMEWLASQLGHAFRVTDADSHVPDGSAVYRFFELFDWQSIPASREIARLAARGETRVTPSFKAHLEEKLWLALFWTPALQPLWRSSLRHSHWHRLRQIIPHGWIPDPSPLPPWASLPFLNVHSWQDVAEFSQNQRRLVLKISGFDETAWGSRGVHIGHDLPSSQWRNLLQSALDQAESRPHVVQDFHEGRIIEHPVFRPDGSVETLRGRARICPYFFTDTSGRTSLGGCLATIVPADKKKIHGMSDAVLVPCLVT